MAREYCRTQEEYKAWSQNIGHDCVITTFWVSSDTFCVRVTEWPRNTSSSSLSP